MKEIWKDIPNYEGLYQASNLGRIRNARTNLIRKNVKSFGLYYTIILNVNGKQHLHLVHRLIAQTFIPNPDNKKEINHIDGNKHNNKIDNLEWVTRKENAIHSIKNGLQTKEQLAKAVKSMIRSTQKPILQIKNGKVVAKYKSVREASRTIHCSPAGLSRCLNGKTNTVHGYQWRFEKEN